MIFLQTVIILVAILKTTFFVKCQEIVTLPPKAYMDYAIRNTVDVDNASSEDDEVNRVPLSSNVVPSTDNADSYNKVHHVPDHRFKLISLDNIVHLNPALQVSLWVFIGSLVKAGKILRF